MKIELRGSTWVVDYGPGKGCRPASDVELKLWKDKIRLDFIIWHEGLQPYYPTRKSMDAAIRAERRRGNANR